MCIRDRTKEHWLEVCEFLLEGIFSGIERMDGHPVSQRVEFEVSYPNKNSSPTKASAEQFEGLARSFLIAAPLLYNLSLIHILGYPRQPMSQATEEQKNYIREELTKLDMI